MGSSVSRQTSAALACPLVPRPRGIGKLAAATLLVLAATCAAAHAQVQRVSVSSAGVEANGNTSSGSISPDGRYVVFVSEATNLTPDQKAGMFLKDRQTGLTTWIAETPSGFRPSISTDGRRVVYYRSLLGWYVLDRTTGQSTAIAPVGGDPGQDNNVVSPVISANGEHVAFYSDLRSGTHRGVFVRSLATGATCAAHRSSAGEAGDGYLVARPTVSADGTRVSFISTSRNLVAADFNAVEDAFVHDCVAGTTLRATTNTAASAEPQFAPRATEAALSGNGRYLAVVTATPTQPGGGFSRFEIFDAMTGSSTGASQEYRAPTALGPFTVLSNPALSGDGRVLALIVTEFTRMSQLDSVFRFDLATRSFTPPVLPMFSAPTMLDMDLTRDGEELMFVSAGPTFVDGDTNNVPDAFVFARDGDADGMSSVWELAFGLNPSSAADATLDADGDGATNAEEFAAGTHPQGNPTATRRFAEGAATALFDTRFAIANPSSTTAATVLLRFTPAGAGAQTALLNVPANQSTTVDADWMPAMNGAEFSTTVESNQVVVVDRRMTWPDGSHVETALTQPSAVWHFAEGATVGGFDLFYLLQNTGATPSSVRVRYLKPTGPPVERTYSVPAMSRLTIWVDLVVELAASEVAAEIQVLSGPPIVAERAQYLGRPGRPFAAGHESAGVSSPSTTWTFAEGATGAFFDLFILMSNPNPVAAQVEATFLLPNGSTRQQSYTVNGLSRFNLWVDELTFAGVKALADTAVSVSLRSTNSVPIVAERSMWWPGSFAMWEEAHNSPGATTTGVLWGIADGEVGGDAQSETYVLVANQSTTPATVEVTLLFEGLPTVSKVFAVPPTSRFNVATGTEFPDAQGKRFGVIVRSTGATPTPIVVERAIYSTANGVHWGAGGAALAAKLQ